MSLRWRKLRGMGRLANEAQKFLDRYRNENNCIPETNGELWLMQSYLPEARIVFDVGANVGDWSLQAHKFLKNSPEAKVYAWEPFPATAEKLRARLGPWAEVVTAAASDQDGTAEIWISPCNSTLNSLHQRDSLQASYGIAPAREKVTITTRTLDSFCREKNIEHIDFLKIDVEGHEVAVLRGFRESLAAGRAKLIQMEYGGAWIDSRSLLRDVYRLFENTPYTMHKLFPGELRPMPEYRVEEENFRLKHFVAIVR